MSMRTLLRKQCATVLLFVVFALASDAAEAGKRVALLIGNQTYQSTSVLKNPSNDVELMKATLEDAGFDNVQVALDLDLIEMRKTLRSFEDIAQGAEVAVLYYSGHGMEMNGQNFLIPVDAVLKTDKDVEDETLPLDRAERALQGATKLKLIILDACRNNPFLATMSRSVGSRALQRGLAKVEPQSADMLVAYASKAGTVALDGSGANSPFAEALSKYLTQPGVDVRIALGKVRDEVVQVTKRGQEPFVYGSLGGAQIFLNIKELNITINTPSDKKDEVAPNGISEAAADWQNIRDLADPDLLNAFIAKHGKDPVYRMLAEKKLKLLKEAEAKSDQSADDIAWEALRGSTDAAALKRFVERYPESSHRGEAETQIAGLVPNNPVSTGDQADSPAVRDCQLLAGEPQSLPGFAGVAFMKIDAKRALTACAQAVNERPDDGMLVNLLGRAQDADRNYSEARINYEKAIDLGNLYAMTNLAWFSIYGTDGPVDVEKGRRMFERAAISGNANAQASLAWLYRDGYGGVRQDYAEALKWYTQAANQGNALALGNLGWFYREGLGVTQDYVASLKYYRKAADAGDITSIAAMGYAAQNGLGMAQNFAEAMEWYKKGANQGDAYSMASLGFLFDAGSGVKQDYVEARYWYEKAADAGSAYAMGNLSRLHDQGLGTRVDAKEAVRWAVAAVERGDKGKTDELKTSPTNFTLAFRTELQKVLIERGYYKGPANGQFDQATFEAIDSLSAGRNLADDQSGANNQIDPDSGYDFKPNVKSTTASARECYALAGEPGSEPGFKGVLFANIQIQRAISACSKAIAENPNDSMLHDMLGRAHDIDRNYPLARPAYEKALAMGNSYALANLAWFAVYGNGEPQDMDKGLKMMKASANSGNSYAQASLGWIYREGYGGIGRDYQEAFAWYEKSAVQDYANAQASLGWLYREGLGVQKDLYKSIEWYRKGAENGDLNGMGSLGYALQNGLGTRLDYVEARKWFEIAAQQNDSYSMASLAWLYENGNGVAQDNSEAKYWYQKAADTGSTYAMGNLSYLYDRGLGTRVDTRQAVQLAMKSMEGGEPQFIVDMKAGAVRYSQEFRRELQRALKSRGLYSGALDGVFGVSTVNAIERLTNTGG